MQDSFTDLQYEELSNIEIGFFPKIKWIFISPFNVRGESDVILVTKSDDVYGYGYNRQGRLGLGTVERVPHPTIIPELCGKKIKNVAFGYAFMVLLTETMEGYTCGYEANGRLGRGEIEPGCYKPKKLDLGEIQVIDVKCCLNRSYLLTKTNGVYHFGFSRAIAIFVPIRLTFNHEKIIDFCCGLRHMLALTPNGKVFSFDESDKFPQLVQLAENIFVKSISCGIGHNLLLTNDGKIYAFGYNSFGQLGLGSTIASTSANVEVIDMNIKVTEIFAFHDISMALNANNRVMIWGQLRDGDVASPLEANFDSFQEAINAHSAKTFLYKPLSATGAFRTNRSANRVTDTMAKTFNDPKFSDLQFKLKRKNSQQLENIYVHKWFIAKSSEYFERMLSNNWLESKNSEVVVYGYSYEAFYQFMRFLYTDLVDTDDVELLIEMLQICDEYLDDNLKEKLVSTIKPLVQIGNVCSVYSASVKYQTIELEEYCFEIMSKSGKFVTQTEDFKKMEGDCVKHFVSKFFKDC